MILRLAPEASARQRVLEALRWETRPKLVLWAESDAVLPLETAGSSAPRWVALSRLAKTENVAGFSSHPRSGFETLDRSGAIQL